MAADMIREHAIRYVTFARIAEFVDPTEEISAHYQKPARARFGPPETRKGS